jgi:hypothetical protein
VQSLSSNNKEHFVIIIMHYASLVDHENNNRSVGTLIN